MFPVNPLQTVPQAERLVANERGNRIVQPGKAGETDRGNAESEWISGDPGNSEISCDVVLEGIIAEYLSATPAPVQLRAFHEVRAPVVRKPQSHRLIQT